ncbi:glycoside hydrolase family 28 protein [Flavobacterium sp. HJJ]|uniref:glycoside hydrolase family 28 protein n=1 Tax=Flavobacterium sp. HJJ TaxID=2783792 RepID=UPI00188AA1EC|nr:glycoside hydrolase family 28 protein [Flavobacterium sp. HJJ]MBF4469943.1 glycoside hydrolase family 28 protein [Flavobacterium sp. HJJ]
MKLFKTYTILKNITSKTTVISFACVLLGVFSLHSQEKNQSKEQWKKMLSIVKSVKSPSFPNKTYSILQYGAQANTDFDNTEAITKTIKECSKNGGGTVLVPKGKYHSRAIHLESNVNFHLDKDAEILFSTNPKDYYPLVQTSFEGTELMNYSPLVYAFQKKNVAITGEGILNGQAGSDNWWPWCSSELYGWKKGTPSQADPLNRLRLVEMAENNIPVSERQFGEGHYLRPNFVEFFECKNVLIQNITIINAPFWVIHPIKSENLIVDGVNINSHGPNNDGCDPEYSKNVIIKNCTFNTGDDCIAIKSGRDGDGRRVAMKSENIIVQNCNMFDGHGGVTIGSEISGGVSNVFVEDCKMDSPNLDIAIRLKTNSKRGGLIENFYVRNIQIGQVKEAVLKADMFYNVHGNQLGTFIPRIENIYLENVKVKNGGKYSILAKGYKESPIKNITLENVTIENVKEPYLIENVNNLKFINTYINGKLMKH